MKNIKHFEQIWEESEEYYKNVESSYNSILDEILLKINLFKSLNENQSIPAEESIKIKSHAFGEILMSLTQLSLKDNINAYTALQSAMHFKKIEDLSTKY